MTNTLLVAMTLVVIMQASTLSIMLYYIVQVYKQNKRKGLALLGLLAITILAIMAILK